MQIVQTSEGLYDKCDIMETGISAYYAQRRGISVWSLHSDGRIWRKEEAIYSS